MGLDGIALIEKDPVKVAMLLEIPHVHQRQTAELFLRREGTVQQGVQFLHQRTHAGLDRGLHEVLLAFEIQVEGPLGQPRLPGHAVHGKPLRAFAGDDLDGRLMQAGTGHLRAQGAALFLHRVGGGQSLTHKSDY